MSWNNFADAEQQSSGDLIPHKTLAKVHMKIRPGGYDDPAKGWTDGYATRNENTGAIYLDCEFTIIGGKFNKRKVWSLIGLHSPNGPKWEQMGRSFARAALESARGIKPSDVSEMAIKARQIGGFADLDGLEFAAQIDVQKAKEGSGYDDKNAIQNVITPDHRDYAALMEGQAPTQDAPPKSAPAAAGASVPAWAQ